MSAAELPAEDGVEEEHDRPHLEVVPDPSRLASLRAELHPYLPTRTQLRAPFTGVGAGTRVLIGQGMEWMRKDGWIWDGLTKAGAVAGGLFYGLPAIWTAVSGITGPYAPFVPTAAFICGCIVAKQYAPDVEEKPTPSPAAEAEQVEHQNEEPEHLDEEDEEPIEADEVAALIRAVAARHQHQGVHLDDLLAEDLFEGWEKADLKAALTNEWGLPVESFKLLFKTPQGKAQRVRDGVRLRHLPTPARGAGEGPVRALSAVASQAPVEAPAGTPPGAPAEPVAEAAVGPSPTAPAAPS